MPSVYLTENWDIGYSYSKERLRQFWFSCAFSYSS